MTPNNTNNVANSLMRVAIPIADGQFSEHFGGARQFQIFVWDRTSFRLVGNELFSAPEHQPGSLPKWLEEQDVDAVVVSAIGERALVMLANAGIDAFLAGENRLSSELAAACFLGKLTSANRENSACKGGHHHEGEEGHDHDCGHHHGDHGHSH